MALMNMVADALWLFPALVWRCIAFLLKCWFLFLEFVSLLIKDNRAHANNNNNNNQSLFSVAKLKLLVQKLNYRLFLMPCLMILAHYVLYTCAKKTRRFWSSGASVDRAIWMSISVGTTIAWAYIFFPTLPFGSLVPPNLLTGNVMSAQFSALVQGFLEFFPAIYVYYLVTGVTSVTGSESPAFKIRKFIPVFLSLVPMLASNYSAKNILPSEAIRLIGWLLRFSIVDSATDMTVYYLTVVHGRAWNSDGGGGGGVNRASSLRALCLSAWVILFWQLFSVYELHATSIIGPIPCGIVTGIAAYAMKKEFIS